jgi:L-alanine-DL-glutamate epimerase-like enolase superfamily enzyme
MQIVDVEAIPLSYPMDEKRYYAKGEISRDVVIVKIKTDTGLTGIGEAAYFGGPTVTTETVIEEELSEYLIGEDPRYIEKIWEDIYVGTSQHGRRGLTVTGMSGIDIALWDLAGKIHDVPTYQLLGPFKDKVKAYASAGYYTDREDDTEKLAEDMARYVDDGFTGVKLKLGRDTHTETVAKWNQYKGVSKESLDEDEKRVKAVREAVGPKVDVMVDPNNNWDVKTTLRMAERLKDQDLYAIEEPIPADDTEGMEKINSKVNVPLSGCETAYTRYEFRELIERDCVDIVQPGINWVGGISEGLKIASMAASRNKLFMPHAFSSAIDLAAAIHVTCSIPNSEFVEYDQTDYNGLVTDMVEDPFELDEHGYVSPNDSPGLGITLDESFVDNHRTD